MLMVLLMPKYNYLLIIYEHLDCLDELQDSWESVLGIVEHFAQNQDIFTAVAGPGRWNDPDQVSL